LKNSNFIKIGGGQYRGRKIELPKIETTRPSKSVVRGSIFDTLQGEIYDKAFIELFAGSGSVGFEAISRGVSELYLLELNKVAVDTLKRNRRNFQNEKIEIIEGDSFQNIEKTIADINRDIILYVDPPFSIRDGMSEIYNNLYNLLLKLSRYSTLKYIILEHMSKEMPPNEFGEFKLYKSKKFGKTTISYYFRDKT